MSKIVGIDLGTTNSVVAIFEGGEPVVLQNAQGKSTTPSVVGFKKDGNRLIGDLAKRQAVQNPTHTISSIKRFMGRRHKEVKSEEKMVPYELVGGPDDLVKVKISDKLLTPPEISAMVLQNLKESAETYLGEEVTEAVITVPAYFNDAQRQATKDAGAIAGLTVRRIINEPTAAALAFGLHQNKDQVIAVFDLGGGTFDVSILEQTDINGETVFEVKATNGDTRLGGDDFDEALLNYLAEEFLKESGVDLRKSHDTLQRLKEAAEKAKCELSSSAVTQISLPFIAQKDGQTINLDMELTRAKFEAVCEPLFNRLVGPCKACLKDAGLVASNIDEVILVGGSIRIPKVQEIAREIFGKVANRKVNPDEVVALGAAVQASILENPKTANLTFLDVTPLNLGIELEGGLMEVLIEKNTTIPAKRKREYSTVVDNQPAVDISIYQGNRPIAKDNRLLGKFRLDGIPPAPRGIPRIEVAFDIDADGILDVSARDVATGKKQKITVHSDSGISKDDIARMQKEAEEYAEQDAKAKEQAETKNKCEQLYHSAKKTLAEHGSSMQEADREEIQAALEGLDDALTSKDESLEEKYEALNRSIGLAVSRMYQQNEQDENPVGDDSEAGSDQEQPAEQIAESETPAEAN